MKLKWMWPAAIAGSLAAQTAVAGDPNNYADNAIVQQVARQLVLQGYVIVDIERTFLGRLKFETVADGYEREIVINTNSGDVLRDEIFPYYEAKSAGLDANRDGLADSGVSEAKNVDQSGDSGGISVSSAVAAVAHDAPDAASGDNSNGQSGSHDNSGDTSHGSDGNEDFAPLAPVVVMIP